MDPAAVEATITVFTDFLIKYFIALAAVGALAMALIELWKKVRDSQKRYHGRMVTSWLSSPPGVNNDAYAELLHLTTGIDPGSAQHAAAQLSAARGVKAHLFWVRSRQEYALFAYPLEGMMTRIQDAVDIALSHPGQYRALYAFATAGGAASDVESWLRKSSHGSARDADDGLDARERAALYARLHRVAKRKLDAFALFTGERWVHWNQFASNVAGMAIMFLALSWSEGAHADSGNLGLPVIVVLSLMGGMMSPVAKDMVMALQKARGG
jgi:hypothetical protein